MSETRIITVYIDYKSPYAYLAKDPACELERDFPVTLDWLPYILDIPSYLGSARLDDSGRVIEENRNPHQWRRVKYSYMDCRRQARRRGLVIRDTQKIWDSTLAGAGLYESASAQPGDAARPVDVALKTVWASVWNVRAFEERDYAGIDHLQVAMAVLVTPSFPDEDANGVAITANIDDPAAGGEDGFFINAQLGEASVVQPSPGVTADSLMYYHFHVGQPATYYTRSNLVPPGTTVLTRTQLFELGQSLSAIRDGFDDVYQPPPGHGFLPIDVEWKLDGGAIWIKQARPYPGRGEEE